MATSEKAGVKKATTAKKTTTSGTTKKGTAKKATPAKKTTTPKKQTITTHKGTEVSNKGTIRQIRESEALRAKFLEFFRRSMGVVTPACRNTGIARNTFYRWYDKYPDFKEEVDQIQGEETVDFAESALFQNIQNGDSSSIQFFLKSKGRHRGYGEKLEVTGKDGKDLMPLIAVQVIDNKGEIKNEEKEG